jgi:hypothetical protein
MARSASGLLSPYGGSLSTMIIISTYSLSPPPPCLCIMSAQSKGFWSKFNALVYPSKVVFSRLTIISY